jgi:hypothetical protein
MSMPAEEREKLVLKFAANRIIAHQVLFKKRHRDPTPHFHDELIKLWHSASPKVLVLAFRGGGKSTLAEEAIILLAAMRLMRNVLIIGSSFDRAADRLRAIKHELETNELLIELYGDLRGPAWGLERLVLANGVCIQAFGRGQSLRGVKHLDVRPDLVFIDDVEEDEHIRSPEARQETLRWFMSEVMPALDKDARIRVAATPLDRESLPMQLKRHSGWEVRTYPIECIDAQGQRRAIWPERFPLEWIDAKRREFEEAGAAHSYQQEFMCEPEDPAHKTFTAGMFKIEPRVRVWEPVYAFYDPARSVKATSATTGWAVWSYVGRKIVVWDGGAEYWQPDQIVEHVFKIYAEYVPVQIGVELDGLEQFVMQPLRQEMVKRGVLVPIQGHRAPRNKLAFIGGLQPLLAGGDIVFAKLIAATQQFLNYPSGKIDFPNALAFTLPMRPGQPIYEDFSSMQHVAAELAPHGSSPIVLCLNATRSRTTAVAVQFVGKALHVLADYVREADPGVAIPEIVRDAGLELGRRPVLVAPRTHFGNRYDPVGLAGAVHRMQMQVSAGGDIEPGRAELRKLMQQQTQGLPALQVSSTARWTLNGLAAGYARPVNRQGAVAEEPADGVYRLLIEALESFMASAQVVSEEDDMHQNWAYTRTGQRYKTINPNDAVREEKKSDWINGPRADRVLPAEYQPKSLRRR